jgi:hypothetical protein
MNDTFQIILNHLESRLEYYSDELEELQEKLTDGDWDEDDHDNLEENQSIYLELQNIKEFINKQI